MEGFVNLSVKAMQAQRIDLWLCSVERINVASHIDEFLALLSEDERVRYERFVFEKDRHVYLVSRYLLRTLLSRYLPDTSPKTWCFNYNDYGKPELPNCPLSFNLSHSDNHIVLAFSRDEVLGVDIESHKREVDFQPLAKYSFSTKEYAQIEKLDQEAFRDRFFSLWTLKEAYMKADGRGMSIPLKSFSFLFDDSNRYLARFEPEQKSDSDPWLFWQFETDLDCFISLATQSNGLARGEYRIETKEITGLDKVRELSLPLRELANKDLC